MILLETQSSNWVFLDNPVCPLSSSSICHWCPFYFICTNLLGIDEVSRVKFAGLSTFLWFLIDDCVPCQESLTGSIIWC